jgi:hypothetical protein
MGVKITTDTGIRRYALCQGLMDDKPQLMDSGQEVNDVYDDTKKIAYRCADK